MSEPVGEDFVDAVHAVQHGRAWSIFEHAAHIWRLSADHSPIVAAVKRGWLAFETLPGRERVRSVAIAGAVAAAFHALLLGLVPLPLRPAVPRVFWLLVSIAAAGAAVRRSGVKDHTSDA
jgi:hypothetical protein